MAAFLILLHTPALHFPVLMHDSPCCPRWKSSGHLRLLSTPSGSHCSLSCRLVMTVIVYLPCLPLLFEAFAQLSPVRIAWSCLRAMVGPSLDPPHSSQGQMWWSLCFLKVSSNLHCLGVLLSRRLSETSADLFKVFRYRYFLLDPSVERGHLEWEVWASVLWKILKNLPKQAETQ